MYSSWLSFFASDFMVYSEVILCVHLCFVAVLLSALPLIDLEFNKKFCTVMVRRRLDIENERDHNHFQHQNKQAIILCLNLRVYSDLKLIKWNLYTCKQAYPRTGNFFWLKIFAISWFNALREYFANIIFAVHYCTVQFTYLCIK